MPSVYSLRDVKYIVSGVCPRCTVLPSGWLSGDCKTSGDVEDDGARRASSLPIVYPPCDVYALSKKVSRMCCIHDGFYGTVCGRGR